MSAALKLQMTSAAVRTPAVRAAYSTLARVGVVGIRGGQARVLGVGDILFHDGDEHRRIFVIESGWLKLTRTLSDGQRQIVGFPARGSILGFESSLDYANDCEALTPAVVHSFPVSTILQMCGEPRFAENLLRQVGAQLAEAQTQLVSVGRQSAAQKTAAFLTSLADACDATDGDEFTLPMLRSDIGDFLGLRLETVSRAFSAFRQRGWIAVSARYRCRITNPRALAMLASGARTMKVFRSPLTATGRQYAVPRNTASGSHDGSRRRSQ